MQLLALEYSKGLFECVHASCMLPFVGVARAVWQDVNGNFCLLLCVESKLLYERTERRERHKGRDGEIGEGREK